MLVPINITGPSYQSRSPYVSRQKTVNFYPELTEGGKSEYVLQPFPGLSSFAASVSAVGRGLFAHIDSSGNEILYQLAGETLYTVDVNGNRTSKGTINGSALAIFAGIGTSLAIVSDGLAWDCDGSTVAQITDTDLESPNSCAHLNNQIIYDGDGGRFVSSDVSDATSISGLNYGTAESNADNLIRVYVYDQLLYLFGNKTTEIWTNTGTGNPPFTRLDGIIQVGLGALHSVASNDQVTYFLGDDRQFYVMKGVTATPISSIGISHEVEGFTSISDARASCFQFEGQNFYRVTFINAGKSFCYSEKSRQWFELQSGNTQYRASSQTRCYGKNLVEDYETGAIYELDIDAFDEAGEEVIRTRDTAPLHGGLLGKPGKEITINRFELLIETGMGTASGQGMEPVVMLSISSDGGRTFGTEMWGALGSSGDFIRPVEWHDLGSYLDCRLRVRISDPVLCTVLSAAADLEVGI